VRMITRTVLSLAAAAALAAAAQPTPAPKDAAKSTVSKTTATAAKTKAPKVEAAPAPTAAEIADAKTKGLVWVNLNTKVFHKEGEFYGKTKHGKFMNEAEATKAGYHLAKPSPIKKATKTAGAAKKK
jgi:hypothetical protein